MTDCAVCAHIEAEGWTGLSLVEHCTDCHREWPTRTRQAHCCVCHRHFSSPGAFDLHLASLIHAGCRDPATVRTRSGEPKLQVRDSPYGPIWGRFGERPEALNEP